MSTSSENTSSMNLTVTFRHTEPTDALKQHASEKISACIKKYVRNHSEVHVILSVEKRDHTAEVTVRAKDFDVTSKAVTEDLYTAIDKLMHTLDVQLRKQKEKIVDHKNVPVLS